MRKEHLPKLRKEDLLPPPGAQRHVLEGQALQLRAPALPGHDGDQRRPDLRDLVAKAARQGVAAAVRARRRVGRPAAGQHQRVEALRPKVPGHQERLALLARGPDAGAQAHARAALPHHPLQRARDVRGLVRDGEHAPAALDLERDARALDPAHQVLVGQVRKRRVQEAAVARVSAQELLRRRGIGHVAAALARDVELFAELLVPLQEQDLGPGLPGGDGRHHARRAATDDAHAPHAFSFPT